MRPVIERFLAKISISSSGCWEWTAAINRYGYGRFDPKEKSLFAHRFIYEYYYGSISSELTIDHLCRNRACSNPLHLEQVTTKVNVLRGIGITAMNARKTHCPQGHEYDNENTYRYIFRGKHSRRCKECVKNRQEIYQLKNPERFKKMKAIRDARYYRKKQQERLK